MTSLLHSFAVTEEMISTNQDSYWMERAFEQAEKAGRCGEVPVGAVIVNENNTLIASGANMMVTAKDPTAHAEIVALRRASTILHNYRLPQTTLYVTLEPCLMCAGAMIHARIQRLVFGATDPKTGAIISRYSIGSDSRLNHNFEISYGILQQQCSRLLKDFFAQRRKKEV